MKRKGLFLLLLANVLALTGKSQAVCPTDGILYVNAAAAAGGDGNSWASAYNNLQDALANACSNVNQVWVGKGTYYPDEGGGKADNDRNASFIMKNNLAICGGFAGTEAADFDLAQRDFVANPTILSGDIDKNNALDDGNSYHVIFNFINGLNETAMLNGFTITAGNANGSDFARWGGGMYNDGSSPAIINCRFTNNKAINGAGIYNNFSGPSIINCHFTRNSASTNGAALLNYYSRPTITNCSITNNTAPAGGGGMFNYSSFPIITNSIIWGNTGVQVDFQSTPTITYSIIQDGYTGIGNLNVDPLFVDAANGDLHLQLASPAINAGLNSANSFTTDLDGKPRIVGGSIDMGAYESQVICPSAGILFVNAAATGANNGSTWTDAYNNLQDALANNCPGVTQIWVAKGTYYPDEGGGKTDDDREAAFVMKNNLAIYGGFAGTEAADFDLSQRDFVANSTILSGDIQQNDAAGLTGAALVNDPSRADNSYHVIFNYGNNLDQSARLDGFIITAGNANGSDINDGSGGGLSNVLSAPAVANCHFTNNSASVLGGGIFNTASEASPVITNCSFTNNSVAFGGGGMCNMNGASPTLTNCVFNGNLAQDGGGIFSNNAGNAIITNCSFANNSGGAIKNISSGGQPSIPVLTNCILWNNTGGQIIEGTAGSVAIATYCIVQDGYTGIGNLNVDPLFVDAVNGNLHLQAGSPAINTGLNSANTLSTDLDGKARIVNGTIDRGAYETPAVCPPAGILYVNATAALGGDGTTWEHAFTKLQDALTNTCPGQNGKKQIWVAKGTYYPDEGGGKADNDRNAAFIMKNNLAFYGGFAGTEAADFDLAQRDFVANPTILSGDIDKNNALDDGNSYHVIFNNNNGLDASAIIDGFTITAGKATYSDDNTRGAGMYNVASSPAISHCKFTNCYGVFGGALSLKNASSTINNCSFINNNALYGAGILYEGGSPSIVNCSIVNNTGSFSPGGIFSGTNAASSITNCIIWGNSGAGQIAVQGLTVAPTVTNCIIQIGYNAGGTNILTTDPLFVDAANGDLHLQLASPAINAGLNSANNLLSDLDGNTRIIGGTIDIGAYESQVICPSANILYVNANATGANNGSTWADAYNSLQDALANKCPGVTQIWVAKGIYYPDEGGNKTDNDQNAAFAMKKNLAIYGGFAGTETSLDQRNWKSNPSILSGDIDKDGALANNSFSVVANVGNNLKPTDAILDGFTITGATSTINRTGCGMYNVGSSPTIANCSFTGNNGSYGAGIYNYNNSSPYIFNCSFIGNSAKQGGGMFNEHSAPTITNCSFYGNSASQGGGGGMFNNFSSPSITNCSFTGNSGAPKGGGIFNAYSSSPAITNCIIRGNSPDELIRYDGNPIITYSIVPAGINGEGNLYTDPLFVDASNGNLRLQACSPAINAGTATGAPATDLDGNARPALGGFDMGAYEFSGTPATPLVLTCPPAAKVFACGLPGITTTTKLAYSTSATNITEVAFVTAGGSISGTCGVSGINYQDAIDAANSTTDKTLVNRTFTASDISGKTYTCTQVITLQDYTIDATASSKPVAIGTAATLSATVIPAEAGVPVTFYLDDVSKGTSLTGSDGVATLDVSGLPVDVYQVKATVGDCVEGNAIFSVYNPDGGFVTGAGWIISPPGALVADQLITGKANFGLNAKYQKGKDIVDGDTEFKFKAGNFNFKSLSNDAGSLVISGAKATYRGTGTVNDAGDYGFMVVAIDGDVNGTGADRFRIKIWNRALGNKLVYDNKYEVSEFADDATELGGGAIVIQTPKVKKAAITLQPAATNNETNLAIKVSNNPSAQGQPFRLQVISSDNTSPISVTVLELGGRPVQTWKNQLAGAVLEAGSQWTKGMYIVEAIQDNKRVQVKLLKL